MKNLSIFLIVHIISINLIFSQNLGVGINTTGATANSSAILDVSSTTQGTLITRMTSMQRNAIISPANSLLIFNITTQCFEAYNTSTSTWVAFGCIGCPFPATPTAGTHIPSATKIVWNWNTVSGVTGYKWSTTYDYNTATATSPAGSTSYTEGSLSCNTAYTLYVWSYNACGNSTATTLTQTTSACPCGSTAADIDGNIYNTIGIGTQCWMKENLKTTKYKDNTAIPNVTDNATWAALTTGAYCWYGNLTSNESIYGALYNWYAVNTVKLCPTGWHVPSHDEWTTLERAVCTSSTCATDFPYDVTTQGWRGTDEGGKLKEAGTTHWLSPNTGATNSSGFTALPGGYRYGNGGFGGHGLNGFWWASTEGNSGSAWYRYLNFSDSGIYRDYNYLGYKIYGFSVRCLQN